MKKWKCGGCGFVWDGETAPAACPKCGAPAEKFEAMDEAAANLVERSRHTNSLHARLIALSRDVEAVCKDGIADALDPGCVDVFEKSLAHAYEVMKMAMTEMAVHVGKGKWG
ncbi:MAG: rubredoxin [Kiritimatiellaeota bacterium]|nr:rubredoxin [Kiritimatiellota bacterium]